MKPPNRNFEIPRMKIFNLQDIHFLISHSTTVSINQLT